MNDRADWRDDGEAANAYAQQLVNEDIREALQAAKEHRATEDDIALLAWATGVTERERPMPKTEPGQDPF